MGKAIAGRAPGVHLNEAGRAQAAALAELDGNTHWRAFNTRRRGIRIPNGETMDGVLARVTGQLERIRLSHAAGELVAVVSHGDVLRSIVVDALGISLDLMQRVEIEPASVSVLAFRQGIPRLLLLNSVTGWPAEVISATG